MAEQFRILDNGETVIYGEWIPPPDDLAARLVALADRLDMLSIPLLEAKQVVIDSTEAHFDSESDPSGTKWESLETFYHDAKLKAGYPDEILVRTGAGKTAVTSQEAYFIQENEIWFNPAVLPLAKDGTSYMPLHQRGTAGAFKEADKIQAEGGKLTQEQAQALIARAGRGKNLPQRQWLGLDEIDILAIEEIFNNWFSEQIVEEFPTGGGAGERMGYNIHGEFPIMKYTSRGVPILRTPQGPRFGRLKP